MKRWVPLLWGFGVAAAYVPFLPSNATIGRWGAIAAGAVVLLWVARLRPSPGHLMLAAFLAWIAVGLAWSVSRWDTAGQLAQWIVLAAAFCAAFDLDSLDGVWTGFALGVTVSAGFALAQYAGAPVARHLWEPGVWSIYADPVGLLLSKNMASDAATLALIGCCALRRWPLAVGPLIALWLVGGRTAPFALGAASLAAAWTAWPRLRVDLVCCAAAGAAVVWLAFEAGMLGQFADRWSIWTLTARHLHVLGDGLGAFSVAAPSIEFAHDEFLQYAFELGVGSVFLWGVFGYAMVHGSALERAFLAALGAECLVWFPLHAPAPAFLGMVVAGNVCGRRRRAVLLERARRVARSLGLFDGEPLGIGAMSEADHKRLLPDGRRRPDLHAAPRRRERVPARPQHSLVS